jgi:hypothetical protein
MITLLWKRSKSISSNSFDSGSAMGLKRRRKESYGNIKGPPNGAALQISNENRPQAKDDDHVAALSSFYTHPSTAENPEGHSTVAPNGTEESTKRCLLEPSQAEPEDVMMIHEFSSLVDLAFLPLPPL